MMRAAAPLLLVVGLVLLAIGGAGYLRHEGRRSGRQFYLGLGILVAAVGGTLLLA
ncbi:hypothetical protein [Zavarzinia sp. CC-PAN008]|uniref:hypothetical protein n=1 Tax=Zavarzinia sp. CC-PAN008 TaxID=3243332 RepID=UPI003F749262